MKQKDILILSITVFLTLLAWILLEVKSIHEQTPTDSQIESFSLNYNINGEILKVLEKKTP